LTAGDLSHELRACLEGWEIDGAADLGEDSSLIASGLMDSVALFNLVAWIEDKTGCDVDPTTLNLPDEWDTMARIVGFVMRAHGDAAIPDAAPAHGRNLAPAAIEIVRYSTAHADQVIQLQTRLWSEDPEINRRYLHWKYLENPYYDGSVNIYLAFDAEELVGMRGFYPSRWEGAAGHGPFDLLVADDQVLQESGRNQGIIAQIMQVAFADLNSRGRDYLVNLTGGAVTVLGSLAMGWRSAGNYQPLCRSSRHWRHWLGRTVARLPCFWRFAGPVSTTRADRAPFLHLDRFIDSAVDTHGVPISISRQPKPREMAQLVARLPHDGRIRHVRDESFLTWKFRNPLHEYRFLYRHDRELDGYLVLQRFTRRNASPRVSIVDLEAGDERSRLALLDAAITAGRFSELAVWSATLDASLVSALKSRGFRPADPHLTVHGCPCLLVRPTDATASPAAWTLGGTHPLELSNWDLRRLYTMAG
jgi:acyl carrier protein